MERKIVTYGGYFERFMHIYELRTLYNGNVFRVFFIFDDGNVVVLFNGFQKKTRKTPESDIELAIKIKESYYADKRSSD